MGIEVEEGRIVAARWLAPQIRCVTIAAPEFARGGLEAGTDLGVHLPREAGGLEERRYSIWRTRPASGELELCVHCHGGGPGSRWAVRVSAGEAIAFSRARTLPIALDPAARAHLFLGDATAIACAEAMAAAAGEAVSACFEAGVEARWPDGELARPERVRWVEPSGRPGTALRAWLESSPTLAPGTTAYVTGETWLCSTVQMILVQRLGLARSAVRAMPYWRWRPKL